MSAHISALYFGSVMHHRLIPFRHRFRYRVFSLWLDLDELTGPLTRLKLMPHNRFSLFSFHDRDHGARDGSALRPWVERLLAGAGLDLGGGPIRLLCFPRLLGYVFNPLSVYYCYDRNEALRAIVYEVKNTFGDQHAYVLEVPAARNSGEAIAQSCDKRFFVSPFIGMTSTYRFRIKEPGEQLSVLIRQSVPEGEQLVATLHGRRRPLDDRNLLLAFLRYPLMTMKVIGAIHWEALWLWLKGARFHRHPGPPKHDATLPSSATPRN
jgi:uncharacterized protein